MKSLTSLVFYTNVVLKLVILICLVEFSFEALCNFRSRVKKKWKPETSESEILQCVTDFTLVFYFERR